MKLTALLIATSVAVGLLAGCASPQRGGAAGPGKVVAQTYHARNLPRGTGEIVVRFAPHHVPPPATQWALVGNYGPTPWRQVTPGCPLQKDADTYGVIFQMDPPTPGSPGEPIAPEDLLVTLLEEQRLTLWISYEKKWGPALRRTWR